MALLVETCMGPHICQNAPPLGKVLVVPVTGELSRAESPAGLGAGHLDRPHEGRARAHCVRHPHPRCGAQRGHRETSPFAVFTSVIRQHIHTSYKHQCTRIYLNKDACDLPQTVIN